MTAEEIRAALDDYDRCGHVYGHHFSPLLRALNDKIDQLEKQVASLKQKPTIPPNEERYRTDRTDEGDIRDAGLPEGSKSLPSIDDDGRDQGRRC